MALPVHHPIRILRRNRRPVAAILAASSVVLAVQAARPPGATTVEVVVASRAIPAGTRVTAADLQVARVAPSLAPVDSTGDVSALVGAVVAVSIPEREPLSRSRLLGAALASDPDRPDNQPMPVRLADARAARLLHPGNRVNLIAATTGGAEADSGGASARLVASDVPVLSLPTEEGGFGVDAGSSQGALVLVSVDPEQAVDLAAAEAGGRLTFTVRS